MSDLVQNENHVQDALDRLLHQFKNSEDLKNFFTALLSPLQTVETDLWALYTQRWAADAVGAQLDNLGAIVGQPRQGRTDAVYRLWIQARILANRSTGKADDTLTLLALVTDGAEYSLTEKYVAAYEVLVTELEVDAESVFDLLMQVKPAGVKLTMAYSDQPVTSLFTYDIGPGYDVGLYAGGFGS